MKYIVKPVKQDIFLIPTIGITKLGPNQYEVGIVLFTKAYVFNIKTRNWFN